jgi:NAD(P)-dependent dehydrogenase (short-subunit alcohol dehydrogenase family)
MRIIVTGGNSGIGKATAGALAAAGHSVMIACRTIPKADEATAEMVGNVEVRQLDLADLRSVRRFAASVESLDVLVNNAGVMSQSLPRTADGFEAHIGTKRAMFAAYADSKLAIMLFVDELARRGVRAYIADPSTGDTDITRDSTGVWGWWVELNALPFLAQDPAVAARSSVQAVTTDLPSGTYIAPRFKLLGAPKVTKARRKARDPVMARRLWELSADLTGCDWTVHPTARTRS